MTAIELINIIAPNHCRTSCSDEDLNNAFYLDDDLQEQYRSRCTRCSLLRIVELDNKLPSYFEGGKIFY